MALFQYYLSHIALFGHSFDLIDLLLVYIFCVLKVLCMFVCTHMCVFMCMCFCVFSFFIFYVSVFLFTYLFSKEREKKCGVGWVEKHGEYGRK